MYDGLTEFYMSEPARWGSGEADFGVFWRDEYGQNYRVSYVQATGEVYALRLGYADTSVEVLAVVPPDSTEPGEVYYQTLEQVLAGWVNWIHKPNSLQWVRDRLSVTGFWTLAIGQGQRQHG